MNAAENVTDSCFASMLRLFKKGNEVLESLLCVQKSLHFSVNDKNWENLQDSLDSIKSLSDEYQKIDSELTAMMNQAGIENQSDVYRVFKSFSDSGLSSDLLSQYSKLRRNLLKSKIENKSLSDYLRITNNFIQGVFDKVLPQRKIVLYSRNGTLVKNNPNSILFNAVM